MAKSAEAGAYVRWTFDPSGQVATGIESSSKRAPSLRSVPGAVISVAALPLGKHRIEPKRAQVADMPCGKLAPRLYLSDSVIEAVAVGMTKDGRVPSGMRRDVLLYFHGSAPSHAQRGIGQTKQMERNNISLEPVAPTSHSAHDSAQCVGSRRLADARILSPDRPPLSCASSPPRAAGRLRSPTRKTFADARGFVPEHPYPHLRVELRSSHSLSFVSTRETAIRRGNTLTQA